MDWAKNVNFKTRDFSPLIERVLAGVIYFLVKLFCKSFNWKYMKDSLLLFQFLALLKEFASKACKKSYTPHAVCFQRC